MWKFSISNVALTGPAFSEMRRLPEHVGIEIFYEWGGLQFYTRALEKIMEGRSGEFSIHAPFQYIDFSDECDERELFEYLTEPFELYHRFQARGYVIHTDAPQRVPYADGEAHDRRMRVEDRLLRFDEIARREGVKLLVENLCVGRAGYHLFSEEQYLQLLLRHPQLDCLIDVGHAHVQGFNLPEMQSVLKDRICAYHLHDNDGMWDSHLPLFKGNFDWQEFARSAATHTPNAQMILEYGSPDGIEGLVRDIDLFCALPGSESCSAPS